jgi:MurNAc alpha-1-phosphate uridylyltransferase
MKAMLLAAGYGKRLAPLTLETPKPMLEVAGKPLLQHHIERLAACGIRDLVINTSWLAEQIEDYFGDGSQFGVSISWSREPQPLETGGGIAKALDLLGHQPFLLVNGDIWTDFPLDSLSAQSVANNKNAWLLLVNNPEHNPKGDFALSDGLVTNTLSAKYTFSGISVIRPQLLSEYTQTNPGQESFPLRDVLLPAIEAGKVMGALYHGKWCDVGTVERYQALNNSLVTDI